jgi:formylglycine-generating enzyme required for sulfatase activity
MSGNVYEYVWDWMEFYHQGWADSTLVDPVGPVKGYNKICRGGSAYGCFRASRVGDKANVSIDRMSQDIGFRSVREKEK